VFFYAFAHVVYMRNSILLAIALHDACAVKISHFRRFNRFALLADRTNGCAYATVLRLSSSVTLCIVAKQCVLEQGTIDSLQEVVYEKSIGTKMNDLNLYLEVV